MYSCPLGNSLCLWTKLDPLCSRSWQLFLSWFTHSHLADSSLGWKFISLPSFSSIILPQIQLSLSFRQHVECLLPATCWESHSARPLPLWGLVLVYSVLYINHPLTSVPLTCAHSEGLHFPASPDFSLMYFNDHLCLVTGDSVCIFGPDLHQVPQRSLWPLLSFYFIRYPL